MANAWLKIQLIMKTSHFEANFNKKYLEISPNWRKKPQHFTKKTQKLKKTQGFGKST